MSVQSGSDIVIFRSFRIQRIAPVTFDIGQPMSDKEILNVEHDQAHVHTCYISIDTGPHVTQEVDEERVT
jgi:hypothetical protein